MKIGFSFGRCVRDIVKGIVDINDVMCVIARTHMVDESHVQHVVHEYQNYREYLQGLDPDRCQEVGLELFRSGRVLEPRANGIQVMKVPKEFVWMDLYPTVVNTKNDGVKDAWQAYRVLIGLTEQLPEDGEDAVYQHGEKQIPRPMTDEEKKQQEQALELLARCI
jgi:hypothetical protein